MEKIRVAIVMTAQRLCAMKVEDDGRLETISLDGNESMKYAGESDFLEFADYIKKFYNVSELDDLDFSVVILKAGVDAEKARQIIDIFGIVSDLYVLDAKDFESVFGEGANIFKANDAELDELKKEVGKLKNKNGKLKAELEKLKNKNSGFDFKFERKDSTDEDLVNAYKEKFCNSTFLQTNFEILSQIVGKKRLQPVSVGEYANLIKDIFEKSINIYITKKQIINELEQHKDELSLSDAKMLDEAYHTRSTVFKIFKTEMRYIIDEMNEIAKGNKDAEHENAIKNMLETVNNAIDNYIVNRYRFMMVSNTSRQKEYGEKALIALSDANLYDIYSILRIDLILQGYRVI